MALKPPKKRRQRYGNRPAVSAAKPLQRSRQTALNLPLIIVTSILGGASWFAGTVLHSTLVDTIPRFVLIGIIFAVLCFALCFVIFIFSKATSCFEENIITRSPSGGGVVVIILISTIVILLMAMLFQWIYGLNFGKQASGPTSYIFLIDDSGSMQVSDPSQIRYKAISDVLSDMPDSFPYMVYGFSDWPEIIKKMGPISDGIPQLTGINSGGTSIKSTLNQVLDDYNNRVWDGGKSPKVILLTDGYATDIDFISPIGGTLKDYVSTGISVSTVGLGHAADADLLSDIAQTTGGIFIDVADVAMLSEAMRTAAREYTARDLLSARYMPSLNFLYGFLRVLFITILGLAIGFAASIAYGVQESIPITMISTVVKSILGALIMELGTGLVGLPDRYMWLALWILLAMTIAVKTTRHRGRGQRELTRPTRSPSKAGRKIT